MRIRFKGAGVWARGLTSFADFTNAMTSDFSQLDNAAFEAPKPSAIPAKERRRSGLIINLAVEVAHQACEHAKVNKNTLPSVFVSAIGDTAVTDYMCAKLNQSEKLLSPTKFHNSVHNAPSGYWTISAKNHAPSSFVGGFLQSFGAGLFEASSQAYAENGPVLLVAYDIANQPPFHDIAAISETVGAAFVIEPVTNKNNSSLDVDEQQNSSLIIDATLQFCASSHTKDTLPHSKKLAQLVDNNPIGSALTLLEHLAMVQQGQRVSKYLSFQAAPKASIELELH